MNSLFAVVLSIGAFLLAYRFYGTFLRDKILGLGDSDKTPANELNDGVDFVPTKRVVLFGHHFASIAGLGPIIGPAVAVYWGWLPALLWVVLGTIFLGGVHDFAALAISLRHQGRSIGDLTREIIGERARMLFLWIIFFLLTLAMGLFVFVIAVIFTFLHPEAIIPVFSLMIIASLIGTAVYKYRTSLGPATLVGLALMFIFIGVGVYNPIPVYKWFLEPEARTALDAAVASGELADTKLKAAKMGVGNANLPGQAAAYFKQKGQDSFAVDVNAAAADTRTFWIVVLLGYAFVASVLPVWLLLQPRDYLNSYKLYLGMAAVIVGLVIMNPQIEAPAINPNAASDESAVPWFPFLFITVACGAISGFHNLVASGTTARQLQNERDARAVSYGAMLAEGLLATLVIMACAATFSARGKLFTDVYGTWKAINEGGIGVKLNAFIEGAAVFVSQLGVSVEVAGVFISVMVVAFAMTTLDSATRLLRYNIESIGESVKIAPITNRYVATFLAVIVIGFFGLLKIPTVSAAGQTVWQPAGIVLLLLFGTTNQLLAGLGLLTVSVYLFKSRKPQLSTVLPMVFMLIVTVYAMALNIIKTGRAEQWIPTALGSVILALAIWLVIEGLIAYRSYSAARAKETEDLVEAAS